MLYFTTFLLFSALGVRLLKGMEIVANVVETINISRHMARDQVGILT